MPEGPLEDRAGSLLNRAASHLISLQRADGSWEGEVVWCTMILSQYVIVCHATGRPIDAAVRQQIRQHYRATRTSDGGWALHPEGPAQVFTTALAYVALRLLGVRPEEDLAARARDWLHRQPDGVLAIPTWGRFWLSLLDLYEIDGPAAFPPELFLLPRRVPAHPYRWYCHTRYIYLAMSYLSGCAFKAHLGPLRDALRNELYRQPYHTIPFSAYRTRIAATDLYARPANSLLLVRRLIAVAGWLVPHALRERALRYCLDRILYEQRVTGYQTLSPVNGLLNCLAIYAASPAHAELEPSLAGLEAWRWCDADKGIRYAGARSQAWDTAFAARALTSVNRQLSVDSRQSSINSLRLAHAYLKRTQLLEELPDREREGRESIRGGWCFSDGAHRWPVSDCTAEAVTAILAIEAIPGLIVPGDCIGDDRMSDALSFLLARQNADGGFSTYEPARAGIWLERLNPSEMFRDCMTDRSYVECTASAVEALAGVRAARPHLVAAAGNALERGVAYIRRSQRADGAFPSAWGVYFTYSIFHVAKALRAAGVDAADPALARAAEWLRRTQRGDGGWGEHYSGCLDEAYVEHPRSQAVMTSWATLALAEIDPTSDARRAGLAWLERNQSSDGSWPHDAVNGVFFGTAMLEYILYSVYFPTWALSESPAAGGRLTTDARLTTDGADD